MLNIYINFERILRNHLYLVILYFLESESYLKEMQFIDSYSELLRTKKRFTYS